MAKATIYIRVENQDEWDNIEDKSQWVNVRVKREKTARDEPLTNIPDQPKIDPFWPSM